MASLFAVSPEAVVQIVAFGQKSANARNFANQLMSGAVQIERKDDKTRIYRDKNAKYEIVVNSANNRVESIALKADEAEKPEFDGDYRLTRHALERYRERFADDKTDAQIAYIVNQALKVSTLQAITKLRDGDDAHNYDAIKYNMRLIVCKSTKTVVTIHTIKHEPAPILEKDSPLFGAITATTKRELVKARKAFRKTNRELTEQLASIQIELAHAMVNKTRAKGEHIVSAVERKMDELTAMQSEIMAKLDAEQAKFERVEADAGKVIGA